MSLPDETARECILALQQAQQDLQVLEAHFYDGHATHLQLTVSSLKGQVERALSNAAPYWEDLL